MAALDRALMSVQPHCPRCGNPVLWTYPRPKGDLLTPQPVVCALCGWHGEAPHLIEIPEADRCPR